MNWYVYSVNSEFMNKSWCQFVNYYLANFTNCLNIFSPYKSKIKNKNRKQCFGSVIPSRRDVCFASSCEIRRSYGSFCSSELKIQRENFLSTSTTEPVEENPNRCAKKIKPTENACPTSIFLFFFWSFRLHSWSI